MKRSGDANSTSGDTEPLKKASKLKRSDTIDANDIGLKSDTKMDDEHSTTSKQTQDSQPVETYKTVGCGLHIGRFTVTKFPES